MKMLTVSGSHRGKANLNPMQQPTRWCRFRWDPRGNTSPDVHWLSSRIPELRTLVYYLKSWINKASNACWGTCSTGF